MTVVLRTIRATRQWVKAERVAEKTIGLIPTMGALHEGHLSLVRRARARCHSTVVSIFVNPLQFGAGEDYGRYPRVFAHDLSLLEREGVNAVFHPEPQEMYPRSPSITVSPGKLGEPLCGASRPGHFTGVATVVAKLFNIVQPDYAFFGQKDAQQAVVVQRMVEDLDFPIEIEVCPTVREPDGLALSSRNSYLSAEERSRATVLYRALQRIESLARSGMHDPVQLEQKMQEIIGSAPGAELEYARVVNPQNLEPVQHVDGPVLAAVAVRFGKTRLIDNMTIVPDSNERK
ncbi:MAG: pantoate--beta-alanine ligase [Acidobacteria bacterium]|nr:pantoate--beta-alanine ligase [Acidobacteriota bacterium]